MTSTTKKIGILALQGGYEAHEHLLASLGAEVILVRSVGDLIGIEGLIVPGGEPTLLASLLFENGFLEAIAELHAEEVPIFLTGTAVLLFAREGGVPESLAFLDLRVERGTGMYGDDGEVEQLFVKTLDTKPLPVLFLRSPRISAMGKEVEVLAAMPEDEEMPVIVQQGNVLVSLGHPEFLGDSRLHEYFLTLV